MPVNDRRIEYAPAFHRRHRDTDALRSADGSRRNGRRQAASAAVSRAFRVRCAPLRCLMAVRLGCGKPWSNLCRDRRDAVAHPRVGDSRKELMASAHLRQAPAPAVGWVCKDAYVYICNVLRACRVNGADTAVVTARIDAALKAKLDALARSTKRSKSYLAAEAIAAYVELNEWQIGEIEAGMAELDAGKALSEIQAEERYRKLLQTR